LPVYISLALKLFSKQKSIFRQRKKYRQWAIFKHSSRKGGDSRKKVEDHWYRTLDLKSNPMESSHFENNFKRTISCPATLANMNQPSTSRAYWRYDCSVTYVTHQCGSYHENFSFSVT